MVKKTFMNLLKRLDLFSESLPSFTLQGERNVRTVSGSLCSILILALTFIFGLLKFEHLLERKNPTIVSNEEELDPDEILDTSSEEFMIAFSI